MKRYSISVAAAVLATLAAGPLKAETAATEGTTAAPTANLLTAQATLGIDLLQRLAGEDGSLRTVVVAPASVASALAALDLGADAAMDRAIAKTLGFTADNGKDAMQALRTAAKELGAAPSDQGPLAFANAVFVDPAGGIDPAAISKLADAGVVARTASLAEPAGIAAVNDWVSGQTAGLIPTILTDPIPDAALVALNALHFKDKWLAPFDKRLTSTQPFHLVGGKTSDVPMMRISAEVPLRQDDRFIGVALPYVTEGYSLVVVTTKTEPANVTDFASVADWLTGKDLDKGKVELSLPKFTAAATSRLLHHLDKRGLAEGRSPTAFSGLSAKPLDITDIVQKSLIKVDEEGTEAAAATAVTVTRALVTDVTSMVVDKPFIFALRDDKHGLILLAGYVGDPGNP
jgi:serine protease inhibitor